MRKMSELEERKTQRGRRIIVTDPLCGVERGQAGVTAGYAGGNMTGQICVFVDLDRGEQRRIPIACLEYPGLW
jgi:hypothetical protein